MIHYTILPMDLIFEEEEDIPEQKVIEMDGVSLIVEPTSETEYKVVQLLSTDPQHFLNNNYQPGQMIALKPTFEKI